MHQLWTIANDYSDVSLVCQFVSWACCTKMAEWIDVLLVMETQETFNIVVDVSPHPPMANGRD